MGVKMSIKRKEKKRKEKKEKVEFDFYISGVAAELYLPAWTFEHELGQFSPKRSFGMS